MPITYIATPQVSIGPGIFQNVIATRIFGGPGSGIQPAWGNRQPGDGLVGVSYLWQWDMVDPDRPITYSLVSGALPPGLVLSSVDGHSGSVSGTPTTAGTYSFSIKAQNALGSATKSFSIVINNPTGGEHSYTFCS